MTRAFRKRLQRLLQTRPPAVRRGDPQLELADRIYADQYRDALNILEHLDEDSAPQVARALGRSLVEGAERASRSGHELLPQVAARMHCRQGCSWCCHQALGVHVLDAVNLAAALAGEPLEYQVASRGRDDLRRDFRPCPVLHQGACRAYGGRPVICRAYHSTDVEVCRNIVEARLDQRLAPMELVHYGLVGLTQEAVLSLFEQLGVDRRPVVLGLAVSGLQRDFDGLTRSWMLGGDAFDPYVVL